MLQHAVLFRDFITCFGNDSCVLANAGIIAEATDVFTEHSKGILVPHDQVRHSTAGPAVVHINREPVLMSESQRERRRRGSKRLIAELRSINLKYD